MRNIHFATAAAISAGFSAFALPTAIQASTVGYYAITNIAGTVCDGTTTLSSNEASSYCEESNVGTGEGTNTVVLESRADTGSIGTRTQLSNDGPVSATQLVARAGVRDTLTFGIETGVIELALDIAGGSNFGPLGLGNSRATVSISVSGSGSGGTVFARDERLLSTEGVVETLSSTGSLGITTINLAFTGGSLFLAADMTNEIGCFVTLAGGPCEIGADYFSSLRLVGARVFDQDGLENFASINSELGFDYRTGVEPHNPPSSAVIPLPAAGWLLLGALGALGLLRRRKVI
jgi:hypothetical protein